ncbi:MAG: hypothetical protein U0176_10010 [Bacteroidia bacterium]
MDPIETLRPGKPEEWETKITPWSDYAAIGTQVFMLLLGILGAISYPLICLIPLVVLLIFWPRLAPNSSSVARYLTYHLAMAASLGPLLIRLMLIGFAVLELWGGSGIANKPSHWAMAESGIALPILCAAWMIAQPKRVSRLWWVGAVLGAAVPFGLTLLVLILNQLANGGTWFQHWYMLWLTIIPFGSYLILRKWVQRSHHPSAVRRYSLLIYMATAYFLLQMQTWNWFVDPFVKALPKFTFDYQTWQWKDGFLPDERFLLKAKISEDEFLTYVKDLGLEPATPDLPNLWNSPFGNEAPFWDCDGKMEGSYVDVPYPEMPLESNTVAKYQNGYLYLNYNRM